MRKNPFTLVEMLCVVAIIAILCGIVFGVSGAVRSRNAEIKTRAMLKQIEIALEECKNKFGYYPQSTSSAFADMQKGWFVVDEDDPPGNNEKKKYSLTFRKACNFTSFEINGGNICDAWGNPLQYKSNGKSYTIYSKGQDGKDSTNSSVDENEDGIADTDEDNIELE